MEGKRPKRVKTSGKVIGDPFTLRAICRGGPTPVDVQMTAEVKDYGPPEQAMVAFNTTALAGGEISAKLKGDSGWIDDQGLLSFQLEGDLNSEEVVRELDARFRDGWLSFAAEKQSAEFKQIKGGWERKYTNVLFFDEEKQQKSVIAVKEKLFKEFKLSFRYTNDVVVAVQAALCKKLPEFAGKLVPHEYTFFYGTSRANCTKWHTDSDEHKGVVLVLTSLTLLTRADTSMNIATKSETWIKEPFETVVFDPDLYHRSGATSFAVLKLSIHWKLRSESSPARVKGEQTKGASSSSDQPVEPPAEDKEDQNEDAQGKKPKLDPLQGADDTVQENEGGGGNSDGAQAKNVDNFGPEDALEAQKKAFTEALA